MAKLKVAINIKRTMWYYVLKVGLMMRLPIFVKAIKDKALYKAYVEDRYIRAYSLSDLI